MIVIHIGGYSDYLSLTFNELLKMYLFIVILFPMINTKSFFRLNEAVKRLIVERSKIRG